MGTAQLYCLILKKQMKAQLQYPLNAAVGFLNQLLTSFLEFVAMWTLFDRFGQVDGWTFEEVFLTYSLINMAAAVSETLMRGFETNLTSLIRRGEYDRYLLRPRSTFFQISAFSFDLVRLGRVFQAAVVFVAGIVLNAERIVGLEWIVLGYTLLASFALYFALYIVTGIISFRVLQQTEFMSIFIQGSTSTMQYPMTIYPKWIQDLFTYVLPAAAVSYFPISAILGKPLSISPAAACLMPFLCYILLWVVILIFHRMERTYVSSGS